MTFLTTLWSRAARSFALRGLVSALVALAVLAVPGIEGWNAAREARKSRSTSFEPFVLQSHPSGCGAAILATILAASGHSVSEAELLAAAPPGPDGITLATFQRLAAQHALHGRWQRTSPGAVPTGSFVAHYDRPYGHFVWVVDQVGAYLHVIDPQTGPHVLHVERFRARFSGRYLRFEATA
jgi:ABC-type bacteriocin/lantibiotic exporters, contain an N-terminal double-glycine peptidase domain